MDRFDVSEDLITTEAKLGKDLALDSLDAMELIMELENAFNITIPDEEAESIETFGDLVRCIEQKI